MAKLAGVAVSLLNAVVLGTVAYRSKAPKAWTLQANMPWIQRPQWPTSNSDLLSALLLVDAALAILVNNSQFTTPDNLVQPLLVLQTKITERVRRLTNSSTATDHREYMTMAIKCIKSLDQPTLKFIYAWFLVRGASCLSGFGDPVSVKEFQRRVRLALGRDNSETNTVFNEVSRITRIQAPLPLQDPYYDLTLDDLYEGSESWPRASCGSSAAPTGPAVP